MNIIMLLTLGAVLGVAVAVAILKILETKKIQKAKSESDILIKDALNKKESILEKANSESFEIQKRSEKLEERLLEKEEKLEKKLDDIEEKQDKLISEREQIKEDSALLREKEGELDNKLAELSKLSEEEARELFLKQVGDKYENDAISIIEKHKKNIEERKQEVAREIIIKSIQQYAGDVTSEVTTTLIELPSDDIKGKLIGKEGRNIVAFERATQVALIIDDTPDTVFISSFDLYKRYVAKKSLEKLLEDGRIQPARIEEVVSSIEEDAGVLLKDLGQKTLDDLNITGIPEEIVPLIGKLRFRTSYGQNILKHSIEVAYIAESMAKDLGVDSTLVKKGALLHDLGKALDHDIEGTHPEIGANIGRKYGLKEEVVDMIENHHGEHFSISIQSAIVQMADAISSVRPGARRESIELYIKRVKEMESLVASFSGVSKAYAVSAGREVRVFVDSNTVSDMEALSLAKEISEEVQAKLNYPGEVKINLIREMRVIEFAK